MAGKIAGMLTGDHWLQERQPLECSHPEVTPCSTSNSRRAQTSRSPQRTAPAVIASSGAWKDQWTFSPPACERLVLSQDKDYSGVYKTTIYHTLYDTPVADDYRFLGDISKFELRVPRSSTVPADLLARRPGRRFEARSCGRRRREPLVPRAEVLASRRRRRVRRLRGGGQALRP